MNRSTMHITVEFIAIHIAQSPTQHTFFPSYHPQLDVALRIASRQQLKQLLQPSSHTPPRQYYMAAVSQRSFCWRH